MHVVLGLLGTVVTILLLLSRLADAGIDLGGLNPFLWQRRRKWKQKYEGNPIFKLSDPMDVTALLMLAVAKCDGEITREQKSRVLGLFQSEFHLSLKDAQGLLIASAHLHGDGVELREKLRDVIAPALAQFSEAQARSAIELVKNVAAGEAASSRERDGLVAAIEAELGKRFRREGAWA
jgi:tellurite resistance protein